MTLESKQIQQPLNRLDEVVEICSKEVVGEKESIKQIILTIISAFTENPQNTRVLAPAGEGKTWIVQHTSDSFPQENIIKLANATPQSFKYSTSKKVIENGPGNYQDYDIAMDPLLEQLEETQDKHDKKEIKKKIKDLQNNTYDLIDFKDKCLIFLDNQSQELWQNLKTNLSHDDLYLKSYSVNKNKAGGISNQKIIFVGWPAVIYCSAKDEVSKDKTDEINQRFNTFSLKGSNEKYKKMLKLTGLRLGLPGPIYEKEIISNDQLETAQQLVKEMIENVKSYREITKPVVNPFSEWTADQFKDDAGFRNRQLTQLQSNVNVLVLCNADQRPKIAINGEYYPVALKSDIIQANELTKESPRISISKIQFFNDKIKPAVQNIGIVYKIIEGKVLAATAREIADEINEKEPNLSIDRKKLLENYLQPLTDHGYLDDYTDPNQKNRYIFSIAPRYREKDAQFESTFIDESTIDDLCVEVFIKKYFECRLESEKIKYIDHFNKQVSLNEFVTILTSKETSLSLPS